MGEASCPRFEVEIVYALADEQFVQTLRVAAGTTIAEAIEQSELHARYPAIARARADAGIFGRRVDASTVLREFDRIEIYRPLIVDPMDIRRTRSKAGKAPR